MRKLVIFGDGPERPALESLINELGLEGRVIMPGFIANPYKFIRAADLFVLSSCYEGLPNALIEALAVGCPVVSTACRSGPKEVLLDGAGGELVPVSDPEAMAEAMQKVLDNPQVRAGEVGFCSGTFVPLLARGGRTAIAGRLGRVPRGGPLGNRRRLEAEWPARGAG